MSLNRDQINSIAHLARLSLTDAEVPVYQDSLSKIVDLVGQLDAAETAGIEPMAHPLPGLAQRQIPENRAAPPGCDWWRKRHNASKQELLH